MTGLPTVNEADVAALARVAGIEVPAEYRAGVAVQLAAALVQAQLVMSLPLDESVEPAPVFRP